MAKPLKMDKTDWGKVSRSFVLGLTGIASALGYVWLNDETNQNLVVLVVASFGPVVVQFLKKLFGNTEGDAS